MKNIKELVKFECKRMVTSKNTLIYAILYFVAFVISAIFFKLYGSEGSSLITPNAQSFPIQHISGGYFITGVFMAIYVSQIVIGDRSNGTIKLALLRSVSRLEYFVSKILSILIFSLLLTMMMVALGYVVGMIFFGWGEKLVFHSITAFGFKGISLTLQSGLAFAITHFTFGIIVFAVSIVSNSLIKNVSTMAIILMIGEYGELFSQIKKYSIFHQMYFFCVDILEQPLQDNIANLIIISPLYNFIHDNQMTEVLILEPL